MKKENPKQVAIAEIRKIKEHVADLHEALVIYAERESGNLARDCSKQTQKLSKFLKSTLAGLGKVKSKR